MIYAVVMGNLWATARVEGFGGRSLRLLRPVDPRDGQAYGNTVVAVDLVGARVGDRVLVVYEGGSARLAMEDNATPCEAVIVGIVDRTDMVNT